MIKMRRHISALAAGQTALFTTAINNCRFSAFFVERFSAFCKALYLRAFQHRSEKRRWSI
jgi:hypothetical protein